MVRWMKHGQMEGETDSDDDDEVRKKSEQLVGGVKYS